MYVSKLTNTCVCDDENGEKQVNKHTELGVCKYLYACIENASKLSFATRRHRKEQFSQVVDLFAELLLSI